MVPEQLYRKWEAQQAEALRMWTIRVEEDRKLARLRIAIAKARVARALHALS